MLEITTEYREGILFVRLDGKLLSNTISSFQLELNRWLSYGVSDIVFNLKNLKEIDVTGIHILFESYQIVHNTYGHSFICGMNHHVNEYLKKSKILNYIYEISDELNAIKVMKWVRKN